jgi:hypothetical protein
MTDGGNVTALAHVRHTLLRVRAASSLREAQMDVDTGLAALDQVAAGLDKYTIEELQQELQDRQAAAERADLQTQCHPDNAPPAEVLAAVRWCAMAWDPRARLLGNVRAGDMVRAIDAVLQDRASDTKPTRAGFPTYEDLRAQRPAYVPGVHTWMQYRGTICCLWCMGGVVAKGDKPCKGPVRLTLRDGDG